jgi:hypothetical protein
MEFGWWAALYARFGVPYPVVSYLVVALLGAGFTSGVWWLTAESYKNQQREQLARAPVVDNQPLEDAKVKLAQVEERLRRAEDEKERERKEKERAQQQLDERAERKKVSEALGEFMLTGRAIQQRCGNEAQPAPGTDADDWAAGVEKYLTAHLGVSYVARFRNSAGLPMAGNSIASIPHRNVWAFLHVRLARLDEFLKEQAPL